MRIRSLSCRALVACASFALISAFVASSAVAGTISGVNSISGPGLGFAAVPGISTANADNDNQTGGGPDDNNIVVPLKRFDSTGYIDIEFTVDPSNGVTEYQAIEFVDNNSGSSWVNYEMQLGFGVGDAFVPSVAGDWVDFDHPNFDTPPTSGAFATVGLGEDLLTFGTGVQAAGAQPYRFRLDVGNAPTPTAGNTFTLRQIGVVPEPTSIVLVALALSAVAVFRRR